ncbi:putative lipid II flippase FtsW [Blochmannia endosymbiont of Polyrhachis (Hedomyrma) turneri]|uniref:putative lipid II flippase FtsW n=1 Tax=Blochmannia endosymbiont of Polyrhachis (Hedomyrma) turneri TaxID=1505596 RepID=UPI000696FF70|nr:putative lipid II flippase FtsW [Blochmannia endosymbiont of Polyrhachis (Hedomyrma) turneri]
MLINLLIKKLKYLLTFRLNSSPIVLLYDRLLLWLILCLSCIGLIMVTSSSMFVGIKYFNDSLYFLKREILYYFLSGLLSVCVLYFPIYIWQRFSFFLLLITLIILLLIPIFGYSINGASRWIIYGYFHIQPSELLKLTFFCYFANYLDKMKGVFINILDICEPVIIIFIFFLLLLMQPDFGAVIIFILTILSVLFISGILWWKFLFLVSFIILLVVLLIFEQPYRIYRIISFWNPWLDPFGGGYQLIQSLVAFGRGEFFGQGLGNSIQKFEYLPEAYSDFIFSIIAEELGFLGVLLILFMMILVIFRGMLISYKAFKMRQLFFAYLSSAINFCFSFQVLINIGTVTGMLPTKGSTLPLISYGGSSFLVAFLSIVFLLRIDFELRVIDDQAFIKGFVE